MRAAGGGLDVVAGLAKFSGTRWEAGPRVPAAQFLRWVFTGRVVPHRRRAAAAFAPSWDTVWTAAQYAGEEAVHLEAEERREAAEAQARWEQQRERQQREEQTQAGGEHQAAIQALLDRQAGLEGPVFDFVRQETGFYPFPPDHGSAEFAMGCPCTSE